MEIYKIGVSGMKSFDITLNNNINPECEGLFSSSYSVELNFDGLNLYERIKATIQLLRCLVRVLYDGTIRMKILENEIEISK